MARVEGVGVGGAQQGCRVRRHGIGGGAQCSGHLVVGVHIKQRSTHPAAAAGVRSGGGAVYVACRQAVWAFGLSGASTVLGVGWGLHGGRQAGG